jgi:ATP-dependent Clp protease adaptor protein ClpS
MFKVLYVNDDVTSMQFVVGSLMQHFGYDEDSATTIANDVHTNGSAVVAVLPYEIAEQLGIEVTDEARNQGYPLIIKIESQS